MVVVGCSLNEAYGIPKRRKDKKKKNKDLNIGGYDNNNFSPVDDIGKIQEEDNLPKYLFISQLGRYSFLDDVDNYSKS